MPVPDSETVLLVTRNGMGDAEPALQQKLITTYFKLLDENNLLPAVICFYANGVRLVVEGSPVIDTLKSLEAKGVRLVLGPGSLKINSTNSDQEDAQEELEIDYSGDGLDIGFNVTYLLDVLANLKCEQVAFALGDALGSALVTMPDSEQFKYVVMPMRI